jgi:hypothetical protein
MSDIAALRASTTGLGAVLATATTIKSSGTCSAIVNDVTTTVQVARDLTVAVGDVLILQRVGSQWFALGRAYTAAPAGVENETAPPPKPVTTSGTLVVAPVDTRSYRNGAWRTDNTNVYQGQYGGGGNHTGAVFYGTKPRSLSGATVTSARIRVRRSAGGGIIAPQSTTMRLVTQATRPGGAPTLTSSTSGPSLARGASSTFTIPDAWAQAMVNGTAGGLGFFDSDGSPYVIFDGRGSWGPAFTLSISWTRS